MPIDSAGNDNAPEAPNRTKHELERSRSDFEASAEETRHAISRVSACLERVADMRKKQACAIADADAFKAQWSMMLRETDGVLTKDLQDLRSAERDARALAEELALIGLEAERSVEELSISAATSASKSVALRRVVLRLVADEALANLLAKFTGDLQRAYSLFRRCEVESRTRRDRPDEGELLNAFATRVTASLALASSDFDGGLNAAMGVSELDLTGIDLELMSSPAKRSLLARTTASH